MSIFYSPESETELEVYPGFLKKGWLESYNAGCYACF